MPEKLIPKIREKIEQKLKELNLKPLITPQKFIEKTKGEKHRYSSVCQDKKGKLIVFYARLHQNEDAKEKVTKELLFGKELRNKNFKEKLLFSNFLPKYFDGAIEKDFEWFTREYVKEQPLGVNEKLTKKIDSREIELIASAICQISKTDVSLFGNIRLPMFPVKNYIQIPKTIPFNKQLLNNGTNTQKLAKLTERNYELLKRENKYLSHGDFNLGNIMETRKELKIIDWESMKVNNFAFDVAYLFMHLWEGNKKIRKELVEKYISLLPQTKKETFKVLFQIVVAYLALGGINVKPREIAATRLEKRKKFFQKVLQQAFSGFKALISI
ncbi:phosphotransferase [bacterium]|nr:phosphotransferase [bacterium]